MTTVLSRVDTNGYRKCSVRWARRAPTRSAGGRHWWQGRLLELIEYRVIEDGAGSSANQDDTPMNVGSFDVGIPYRSRCPGRPYTVW